MTTNISQAIAYGQSGENPIGFTATVVNAQFDPLGLKVVVQRGNRQIDCRSTISGVVIGDQVTVLNLKPPIVIGVIQK